MLKPLAEPSFRTLFLARSVSSAGDSFLPVALAFAVLDLTGSAVDLGIVLAAATIPSLLLLPLGGVWADRLPRGRVMLVADLARGVTQATVAILLISGHAEVWHLVVLQVVDGSAEAFFNPASGAIVPETISGRLLREANALLGFSTGLSYAVGPGVAGILVAATSPGWAIAFDSMTFLVSAALLLRLRLPSRVASEASTSFWRDFVAGWDEFRSRTWVWLMVVHWSLLLLFAEAPLDVLGRSPLVDRSAGLPPGVRSRPDSPWGSSAAGWSPPASPRRDRCSRAPSPCSPLRPRTRCWPREPGSRSSSSAASSPGSRSLSTARFGRPRCNSSYQPIAFPA